MVTGIMFLTLFFALGYAQQNPLDAAETLALSQKIVDYHNWQRHWSVLGVIPGEGGTNGVHPGASDMVNLIWDDGLAAVAQAHSETCKYHHNPDRSDQAYDARDTMVKFVADKVTMSIGENIGFGTWAAPSTPEDIVLNGLQAMTEESTGYWFNNDDCDLEHCGHYTQIVWATTRVIGCGLSMCDTLFDECEDDGSGCTSSTVSNAVYYVCNYWPLGNRYVTSTDDASGTTTNTLVPIYTQGDPCANCPWDHDLCSYDDSLPQTYDPDWHNTPWDDTDQLTNGLCVGCGNEYYEICATGLNNGLADNCEDNIASGGCFYDWGADSDGMMGSLQMCDPTDDLANGLEDADICTVGDGCRYQCGTCFCQEDNTKFKACETECDDGVGRNVTGGCAGDSWFTTYVDDIVGGCPSADGTIGDGDVTWPWDGANQMHLSMFAFLLSSISAVILIA